jgi:hypothetical protein
MGDKLYFFVHNEAQVFADMELLLVLVRLVRDVVQGLVLEELALPQQVLLQVS